MYDIVLEISFLDVDSQNWNTASHLKLLPKSLTIRYKFFLFRPFFDLFFKFDDQKNAPSQKFVNMKNQILHASQPREGIFDICSHLSCVVFLQFFARLQMAGSIPILRIDV